ncbi:MAG: 5'-nucleotidase C-terminal domain-containing protein [Bacteroidota bacterium]
MKFLRTLAFGLACLLVVIQELSAQVITIDSARNTTIGTTVTIRGVVTRAAGRLTYLQDSTAGIALFQTSGAFRDSVNSGFVVSGAEFEITGEVNQFNDLLQLSPVTGFTRVSTGNALPMFQSVSLGDLKTNGEAFESELVRVGPIQLVTPATGTWQTSTSYDVRDANDTLTLRTPSSSDTRINTQDIPAGEFYFEGVVGDFRGNYQLSPVDSTDVYEAFVLTVLHNNDAESQMIDAGTPNTAFGGAARFKTLVDTLKSRGSGMNKGVVMLSSGDNYLPGPEFNASLNRNPALPYYDAVVIDSIGYDALCLGNHDFDFGPDVLANLISDVTVTQPSFLSSNLDFTAEPNLQALVNTGRIAPSTIITKNGVQIGVVGATTPNLASISSPRNVGVGQNVAASVQAEINSLKAQGVNTIILISHLQSIGEDTNMVKTLTDVDVVIAGGGDEVLANPGDLLVPGDTPDGPYPIQVADADGNTVYVVTTPGNFKYVGQLKLSFSPMGEVVMLDTTSGMVRVSTVAPDSIGTNQGVQTNVIDSLTLYVASLDTTFAARTLVDLDGTRGSIRSVETNQGNLIADGFLWQGRRLASNFGVPAPDVALANGGGIRNDNVIPANDTLSELTTFDISPFANFVSIVPNISPAQFKEILENAYSRVDTSAGGTGRFAQVAGFTVVYDTAGTRIFYDANGNITRNGDRIIEVILDDGTPIVVNKQVVPGAPNVTIAIPDFLARGGDQYPFRGAPFTNLGVTDQQTLFAYLTQELSGTISAMDYPVGGENRIVRGPVAARDTSVLTPIGVARNLPLGDTVKVRGIVTRAKGRISYLQEGNFAISTFQSTGAYADSIASGFISPGDTVEIVGEVADFNGQNQFNPVISFTRISTGNPLPTPQPVTIADLATNGESFESELVTATDLFIPGVSGVWDDNFTYNPVDPTGTGFFRVTRTSDSDLALKPIQTEAFTYVGVINEFRGDYQFYPIDSTDVFAEKFTLTVLHNNDAESQMIDAGGTNTDFGGAARFKTVIDTLKMMGSGTNQGVITLTSGDNFLAGPEFNASLNRNAALPYYDAVVIDSIGYDALCLGNHDFDFGPSILENLIRDITVTEPPFLSANLDFTGEAGLQDLVDSGRIAPRVIVTKNGRRIGVIGATTANLASISSPGNVQVLQNIGQLIQDQVDSLKNAGVNKIILISHLQSIGEDTNLVKTLTDIDVVIAGGGDELLANPGDLLLPGDSPDGAYPLQVTDANNDTVFVVTTPGEFKYAGRLVIEFDPEGNVVMLDTVSGPVRVSTVAPDAVVPDPGVQTNVVDSLVQYVSGLATNIIGVTQVDLDGRRSSVRSIETNQGNLIADAYLWQANELAASFSIDTATVAMANGGGIRNDNIIPAGTQISELLTFDMLPFGNLVSIVPDISPAQFKEILENAYSRVDTSAGGTGRFAQIAGFEVIYDTAGTRILYDANGNIVRNGDRIIEVTLAEGTKIVENKQVVSGAPDVNIAIPNFLARGGDQYPFRGAAFTSLGVTDQQSLFNYILNSINGTIDANNYPVGGEGRINRDTFITISVTDMMGAAELDFTVYPNPATNMATFRYELPEAADVTLAVFSLEGRQVMTLQEGFQQAGEQQIRWDLNADGAQLSSGMYLIRLKVDEVVSTKRLNVLR